MCTWIDTVKCYRSFLWLDELHIFAVIRFQSVNTNAKKSQYVSNKNIILWKVVERLLFPHCVASKNPRVGWTHSFVFLMHRNLRIKSFARTFHEIISLYLMFFYSFQSWNQMTPTPDYHNPSLTKLALESCFLKRNRKGRTNLIESFFDKLQVLCFPVLWRKCICFSQLDTKTRDLHSENNILIYFHMKYHLRYK